jgi:glycosyltransferase involved in cell wall biosynthesis
MLHRYHRRIPGTLGAFVEQIPTRNLARLLKARRIDVVFAEYGVTASQIADACRQARVPLVAQFHGFDAYKQSALDLYQASYPRLFEYASAILSVSAAMCDRLKKIGAPSEKIFYVPSGIDLTMFTQTDPASAGPHFLAVGRFVNKKAPYLTVLAFRETLQECPDARLIMAGEGPLLECSKQLAVTMGVGHAIEFPGVVPHTRVAELMKTSRAFVQHSITPSDGDSEGTPVSILEAAASGLPVISTEHAGISEAVLNGKTGLLVNEGDIQGMGRNIATLVRDPAYARRLGLNAREHVGHRYASDRCISRLAEILKWAASRAELAQAPGRMPEWWTQTVNA